MGMGAASWSKDRAPEGAAAAEAAEAPAPEVVAPAPEVAEEAPKSGWKSKKKK